MVEEEVARRLAAAAAEGVIKEAGVQVFVVQPGIQSAAVLAQVGDGGGFVGKQGAQGQGVLLQISDDAAHAVRQVVARQLPVAPVFSGGQITELVGIENAADVTVWQGLALRPLFELPGGEHDVHQHGDVMHTVVAAALKADFTDGVFIGQGFFQHLPFLQETEAVQLRSDLCAGVKEGFAGGHGERKSRGCLAWWGFGAKRKFCAALFNIFWLASREDNELPSLLRVSIFYDFI